MARSRPPSFDFYPEDFLVGTMQLHPVCIGIYVRLLCFQWSHGAVSEDFEEITRISGIAPEELKKHLPQVLNKFEKGADGLLRNARLERERARKTLLSEARANAARNRWSSRTDDLDDSVGDAIAYPNADANIDTKGMPPIRKLEVGSMEVGSMDSGGGVGEERRSGCEWVIPSELDTPVVRELLKDFASMRKRIKKPISDFRSTSRVLKRFDDSEHLIFALETCIANDYQGLKPEYRPPEKTKEKLGSKTFAQQREENSRKAVQEFLSDG